MESKTMTKERREKLEQYARMREQAKREALNAYAFTPEGKQPADTIWEEMETRALYGFEASYIGEKACDYLGEIEESPAMRRAAGKWAEAKKAGKGSYKKLNQAINGEGMTEEERREAIDKAASAYAAALSAEAIEATLCEWLEAESLRKWKEKKAREQAEEKAGGEQSPALKAAQALEGLALEAKEQAKASRAKAKKSREGSKAREAQARKASRQEAEAKAYERAAAIAREAAKGAKE